MLLGLKPDVSKTGHRVVGSANGWSALSLCVGRKEGVGLLWIFSHAGWSRRLLLRLEPRALQAGRQSNGASRQQEGKLGTCTLWAGDLLSRSVSGGGGRSGFYDCVNLSVLR